MQIKALKLQGTYEIILAPRQDDRGYFMRTYDREIFEQHGLATDWLQENQSLSQNKGTIRGLHFQKPPHTETKLVRALFGKVWDVFVDLRKNSATYGQWDAIELSAESQNCVYIPKGFAHGFCTLTEPAIVFYKVDAMYQPEAEGGLSWNDPSLAIPWPAEQPQLSPKDSKLGTLSDFVSPFI
jgi:dTDP-4-dehydrorhamnose 3,5-epimerase